MSSDLKQFVKEDNGKFSATRLSFVAWSLVILVMWAFVSFQRQELVVIDNSIVSILGVLMSGKVVQRFGEKMKTVFTNGCFDIVHVGHVKLLEYCSKCFPNSRLIVGINSDESFERIKGRRPENTAQDRQSVIESIRWVDKAIIFEEDTPFNLIKMLKPDLIVKGADYKVEEVVGRDIAPVRIFPFLNKKKYSLSRYGSKTR